MPFISVPEALEEIRSGRILVVVDDEDRENEGDLTVAAEKVTPEIVNFMATHGRGLICMALTPERCDYLALPLMTAWIVSPSARARSNRFRTTTAAPLPPTVPPASSAKARQCPSGEAMPPGW